MGLHQFVWKSQLEGRLTEWYYFQSTSFLIGQYLLRGNSCRRWSTIYFKSHGRTFSLSSPPVRWSCLRASPAQIQSETIKLTKLTLSIKIRSYFLSICEKLIKGVQKNLFLMLAVNFINPFQSCPFSSKTVAMINDNPENYTVPKIRFMYSRKRNSRSQFLHSCICEGLYIPRIGLPIGCSKIGKPFLGIYKSLQDTWMWKLGDRAL